MEKNKECFILIPSCDNYEDAWQPFFGFFFKYWPDCPFPVYLLTETKKFPDERVETINLGQDFGWANNVTKALNMVEMPYFMYFLEDVFLTKPVDTQRILNLLELAKKESAACLRLFPEPGPDMPYKDYKEVGAIKPGAPYRVSTMTAIWDKKAFMDLMVEGESAWAMELEGTKRSASMDRPFLSVPVNDYAINYWATAIKKGRWFYDAIQLCKKEGIPVDTSHRPVETYYESIWEKLSRSRYLGWPFRKIKYLTAKPKKS